MPIRTLDLFCGAGGISCGLEMAGGVIVGGIDLEPSATSTFALNHPDARVWTDDIRKLKVRDIHAEVGDIDLIIGGPMCQGVSQRGPRDPHDERNFAFWAFADFVRTIRPRYFLMENVPALASDLHNRGLAIAVFEELSSLGYHLSAEVVNAAWLGVPQLRHRLIIIGSTEHPVSFPEEVYRGVSGMLLETSFTTVEQAIGDLPEVPSGGGAEVMDYPINNGHLSAYARLMRSKSPALFNHWSADTEDINLQRIRHVSEGGNWHDIPVSLLPERFQSVRPSDHTTTYRRLERNHPAHTITTECGNVTSGAFTHPTQHRAITVREAARLQGFPDRFKFSGPKHNQYKQVGNAVPPLMASKLINAMLDGGCGYRGRLTLQVLKAHPDSRLPFILAPRYKPLFGRSTGVLKRRRTRIHEEALPLG